jgi:hypothetical protein
VPPIYPKRPRGVKRGLPSDTPENINATGSRASPQLPAAATGLRPRATGELLPGVTYWIGDQPLDLDALTDEQLDEMEAEDARAVAGPTPEEEAAFAAWLREMDRQSPVGAPMVGAEYVHRYRKALIYIPPTAKPSMSRCISYCLDRWPRATNICVFAGERPINNYQFREGRWKALRPGQPGYLY